MRHEEWAVKQLEEVVPQFVAKERKCDPDRVGVTSIRFVHILRSVLDDPRVLAKTEEHERRAMKEDGIYSEGYVSAVEGSDEIEDWPYTDKLVALWTFGWILKKE